MVQNILALWKRDTQAGSQQVQKITVDAGDEHNV